MSRLDELDKDFRRKWMVSRTVPTSYSMNDINSKAPRVKVSSSLPLGAMFLVVTSSFHLKLRTDEPYSQYTAVLSHNIVAFTIRWAYHVARASNTGTNRRIKCIRGKCFWICNLEWKTIWMADFWEILHLIKGGGFCIIIHGSNRALLWSYLCSCLADHVRETQTRLLFPVFLPHLNNNNF